LANNKVVLHGKESGECQQLPWMRLVGQGDGLGGKRGVPVAGEDKGMDPRLREDDVWVARLGELIFVRP